MVTTIDRSALKAKLDAREPLVLLESLPETHYRKGHLPGALLMPHDRVRELAALLIPSKAAQVVVYCASASCQNSAQAARQLAELGYAHVQVYEGGKADWTQAGYPLDD